MSELVEHHGTDVLTDVLDSLKLRGRLFCRCELSAPWAIGFAAGVFAHFHVIEQGTCCLQILGEAKPVPLEEGDLVLVIPRGRSYQLSDDPRTPPIPLSEIVGDSQGGLRAIIRHGAGGAETKLLCGAFEFQGPQAAGSLAVFPLCIRVPKRERHANEWLDATVRFLRQETREPSIGSETITTRLIDVMFVEAIRAWLKDQPEGSAGWLGALRDPSIGTTLGLIHKNPEKPWTVPSLAAEVGMSRSPFAARFTALVGQAPMSYLKNWRLQLAARLLQNPALSLSNIAEQVGYESAAAFSRIFKREFGVAPGQFRRAAMSKPGSPDSSPQATIGEDGQDSTARPKTISYTTDEPGPTQATRL
jgi:AraC-like DNA-binding protein